METKNEDTCLKTRSTRATVAAGFRLYMGNFRRIFRTTWLPALLCAVVSAFYYKTIISATVQVQATLTQMAQGGVSQNLLMQYLIQSGVSLLDFVVTLLLLSYVFYMLSRHRQEGAIPYPAHFVTKPDGRSVVRTVAAAIVCVVVYVAAFVPPLVVAYFGAVSKSVVTIGLGLLLMLVMLILLLVPMTYPIMRYVTTRDTRLFDILGKGYVQGLRYCGYIFAVLLVVAIIVAVILVITMLPTIILLSANMRAVTGAAIGDPLGMPSYMGWMSLAVFTLSSFIQAYVLIAAFFPVYYMAGSIEQQEIQRHETTKNTLH